VSAARAPQTVTRRARVANACYLVGGAAMVAAGFVHWVARGPGSGLRGHELVDAVVALGKSVPALSGARLTIVWYLVPALGAGSWIACGLAGARHLASRVVAGAALVVAVVAYLAFARLAGAADLGWGPKLAAGGAVMMCASAWFPRSRRARPDAARSDTMAVPGL
jgi:hypothetical protein